MSNLKLLPCPFCGERGGLIQPIQGPNRVWNAYCTNKREQGKCGVVIYGLGGDTKQSVADRWNTRITKP